MSEIQRENQPEGGPEKSSYIESLLSHAGIAERLRKAEKQGDSGDQDLEASGASPHANGDLHPMTQKAAGWYEKVRNAIDYGEGDQIRRRAIERLLKRRLIFEKNEDMGASLLEDLVTAGYVDAALATDENAAAVDFIVKKYTALFTSREHSESSDPFKKWTRSMAAIEIYRLLFPNDLEKKVLETWLSILKDSIKVDPSIGRARFTSSLRFVALRSLLEQSNPELHFAALEEAYPTWTTLSGKDETFELGSTASELAPRIYDLSRNVDEKINDPLVWYLIKKIKNSRIAMELVKEMIFLYGDRARDVLHDKVKVEAEIRNRLSAKYQKLTKLVKDNGKRALIYILITKITIALAVEVPLDHLMFGSVDTFALAVNIIVPPLLLLVMARWSLGLDSKNTAKIQKAVEHLLKGKNEKIILPASAGSTHVSFAVMAFNAFFYVITFSIIIGVLVAFNFQLVSLTLFLVFIALVCYFGTRVRSAASRWRYEAGHKDSLSLAARLLAFPIMRLGRWLTESFSAINFFVFFMDMVIETPFRLLLAEFNNFMNFVRDRAEDVM